MFDVIQETIIDGIKLLPFLFIAYLIMEYIEHKTSNKMKKGIQKSGRFGPIFGGVLGIFPQCGFSAVAANLYSARIITLGTLISIFLSTSDEMLPILISESVGIDIILKLLTIKLIVGILFGFLIDMCIKRKENNIKIEEMCEQEHCHCEKGILKSAIKHTLNIFVFILIISFMLNITIHFIGEDNLANIILSKPIIGPVIAGLIGLIPNCASSVILTQLYLSNIINISTMLSGLLVGAGVGLLVLFKVNKNLKENFKILFLLYTIGVISGIVIELIGIKL